MQFRTTRSIGELLFTAGTIAVLFLACSVAVAAALTTRLCDHASPLVGRCWCAPRLSTQTAFVKGFLASEIAGNAGNFQLDVPTRIWSVVVCHAAQQSRDFLCAPHGALLLLSLVRSLAADPNSNDVISRDSRP